MTRSRKLLSMLAASAACALVTTVFTAHPANASGGANNDCIGFQGNPSCAAAWDGSRGDAYVTNNPYNDWVFVLHCAWGGDQMSGANPPSADLVTSSLQCNLGSPATGAYIQAT